MGPIASFPAFSRQLWLGCRSFGLLMNESVPSRAMTVAGCERGGLDGHETDLKQFQQIFSLPESGTSQNGHGLA